MSNVKQWAERAEKRIEQSQKRKEEQERALAIDRVLLSKQSPVLWAEVRENLALLCNTFNERQNILVFSQASPDLIIVRRTDGRGTSALTANYDPSLYKIRFSCGENYREDYQTKVVAEGDGDVVLKSLQSGLAKSVEEAAQTALDSLLK